LELQADENFEDEDSDDGSDIDQFNEESSLNMTYTSAYQVYLENTKDAPNPHYDPLYD